MLLFGIKHFDIATAALLLWKLLTDHLIVNIPIKDMQTQNAFSLQFVFSKLHEAGIISEVKMCHFITVKFQKLVSHTGVNTGSLNENVSGFQADPTYAIPRLFMDPRMAKYLDTPFSECLKFRVSMSIQVSQDGFTFELIQVVYHSLLKTVMLSEIAAG